MAGNSRENLTRAESAGEERRSLKLKKHSEDGPVWSRGGLGSPSQLPLRAGDFKDH